MMTILMDGLADAGDRAEVSYSHNIPVAKSWLRILGRKLKTLDIYFMSSGSPAANFLVGEIFIPGIFRTHSPPFCSIPDYCKCCTYKSINLCTISYLSSCQ